MRVFARSLGVPRTDFERGMRVFCARVLPAHLYDLRIYKGF